MSHPFVTPSICHGGEEQHEVHVRYCVPLAEQLADTRTLTRDQVDALLREAIGQFLENRDSHGMSEDLAADTAPGMVVEGLFTDLDDDPDACARCGCTDEWACDDGCFWVAPRLCSACATPADMAARDAGLVIP